MKPVVAAIAVCGLVLTAVPDVAMDAANAAAEEAVPQDAPMSREQRIQVQQGLSALGFDPGPADGLFGPKTRAAIWDWQNAKGLEATGFLTREEAEALGAMGQAAGAYDEDSDPDVAEPDEPAFEESAPNRPALETGYFTSRNVAACTNSHPTSQDAGKRFPTTKNAICFCRDRVLDSARTKSRGLVSASTMRPMEGAR